MATTAPVPTTSMSTSATPVPSLSGPSPSGGGQYLDAPSVIRKLDPALGKTGCIRNLQEVPKVINFMKESNLMVNRCIILNVIKATDAPKTLAKFMDVGGWNMLNVWLAEAKKAQNTPLLTELLLVLQKLPVGIEALKQGNMGKLIKQLSKQESEGEVQTLAGDLLSKWMAVFREGQSAKGKSEDSGAKSTSTKKEKKVAGKKKEGGKGTKGDAPPPESMQPPPGPLVALGRPKDKAVKRPRDLLVGQPPPEKKSKASPGPDTKAGKVFVESEGFMNALQAAKMKEKKIKKVNKSSKVSRTNSSSEEVKQDPSTTPTVQPTVENMEVTTEEDAAKSNKKKVSWATEDNLTRVHYFEMDDSERVNVNRPTSFLDAAQQEKMREREALASGLMFSRDRLIEMVPWQRPVSLEVLGELIVRGTDSQEKETQAEREGKVLAQLFLSKASVQPSPMEPDPEPDMEEKEPKFIPLLEPNASGGQSQPPGPVFGSPPHVPPNAGGQIPPGSPLPSPATTINQAQSLINYFNQHGTNPGPLPGPGTGGRGRGRGGMGSRGAHNGAPGGPYPGSENNYHPQGEGFPPRPSQQQGDGPPGPMGPPPPGHWAGPDGGGFYGEGGFRGQSDGPRGRGFMPIRGRGRGFPPPWKRGLESKICKHFITHGCKLGTRCRFLHCTPEELANKMTNEQGFNARPPRGRGGRFEAGGRSVEPRNGDSFMPPKGQGPPGAQHANSPLIHNVPGVPIGKHEHKGMTNSNDTECNPD